MCSDKDQRTDTTERSFTRMKAGETQRDKAVQVREEVFSGAGREERREWKRNTKRESRREKHIYVERKKVRRRDGKCSGEKGYLCLGVFGTAGRL